MKRLIVILITVSITNVTSLENGLARTPPMGWMSWQRYRCQTNCELYPDDCINEKLIQRTVDRLVSNGWKEAGYTYVITDDCWPEKERDRETMEIVADRKRFPNGIVGLSEYIHAHGLKFGIYLDFGTLTCAGYPGSMNYLEIDAKSLARWKVDYVKVDGCYSPRDKMEAGYEEFGKLLNRTSRPIVYSCSYPAYIPWSSNPKNLDWERLKNNCNLWRTSFDIDDSWDSVLAIINIYRNQQSVLQPVAGPGHWNDPDMLIIGNFGLSFEQQRVQMGMWCILAAPLILSADMDHIDPASEALLKNPHLLSINQDSGGHQAKYIATKEGVQLWTRLLADQSNTWAIAFMNPVSGGAPKAISVTLEEMQLESVTHDPLFFDLTDVFTGDVFGSVQLNETFTVRVNPTGIVMFKVEVHKSKNTVYKILRYLTPRNIYSMFQ